MVNLDSRASLYRAAGKHVTGAEIAIDVDQVRTAAAVGKWWEHLVWSAPP